MTKAVATGAGAKIEGGDSHHDHGKPGRHGEDALRANTHQPGRHDVVGGCPEGATERRSIDQLVEAEDHGERRQEGHQRHQADVERADADRGTFQRPNGHAAAIGGKRFEQAILEDDGDTESDEQRRQHVLAERAIEHEVLQAPTC